jgi:hypothetical protein
MSDLPTPGGPHKNIGRFFLNATLIDFFAPVVVLVLYST